LVWKLAIILDGVYAHPRSGPYAKTNRDGFQKFAKNPVERLADAPTKRPPRLPLRMTGKEAA